MRRIITLMILITSMSLLAQEKTLFNLSEKSNGGFGAPVIKYSQVNNKDALFIGGRGGWVINKTFIFGAGFYGLASNVLTDVYINNQLVNDGDRLHFIYGGLELEYHLNPLDMVHYSFYTLIGLGSVSYHNADQIDPDSYYNHYQMSSPFFVVEPNFNIQMNVTSFFKIAAGVGYRYVAGVNYKNMQDKDLAGLTGTLTFKFGKF